MRKVLCFLLVVIIFTSCKKEQSSALKSPDNRIEVSVFLADGKPKYLVKLDNKVVLDSSALGLSTTNEDFSSNLQLSAVSPQAEVSESYTMSYGKHSSNQYKANERVWTFANSGGSAINIRFRVSNDGLVFRYEFPETTDSTKNILEEHTGFRFTEGTTAFLQPMSVAKTGWSKVNPCYEESYEREIPAGTPSPSPAGWVYPALFHSGDNWVVITESSLQGNYCATRLRAASPGREYRIGFPDSLEVFPGGGYLPLMKAPFASPWRVVAIGDLKTVVESDLGNAVAEKPVIEAPFAKPGHSSWSWALLKDDSTVFDVQKKFVDYAADMHWEYCLVDAEWDKKIGLEKIKELVKHGESKNVGIQVWYNSAGNWNETPYTPKDKLLTSADREREFSQLQSAGVKGIKVDFFGGDGQSMIQYYLDILNDAAKHNLMVNFHGSTIPRGWHRTYPNLMNMEAVKGFENVTFEQRNADEEPVHCTILPFTRNLFDPMDFTPLSLDTVPRIQRKTTAGFELALSVVFTAGITHFVEIPSGMAKVPQEVKEFLRDVPATWDETRFISGYPGKDFVIARRSGSTWYIAGINGENTQKEFTPDLSFITSTEGLLMTDDTSAKKRLAAQQLPISSLNKITAAPFGGFVVVVK